MRTFIDGTGRDSTVRVNQFLQGVTRAYLADLYLIGELEDRDATWLTDWGVPLIWSAYLPQFNASQFTNAVISAGKLTSQEGLKVDALEVTWSPPLTPFGTTQQTSNPYQLAQSGFYDNKTFRLWRSIMRTPGDANELGACPIFGGRIAETEVGRGYIKFTVNSFLDVVNQKVPPNVIEASNAQSGYVGGVPVLADGETAVPTFTVEAPSSPNLILGNTIQPSAGKVYAKNRFRLGFMVFLPGSTLAGYWSPVAGNQSFNAGGGVHYNQFQVYGAFPFAPTPGDTFFVSTQLPLDFASAPAGTFKGFPFVPDPVQAA